MFAALLRCAHERVIINGGQTKRPHPLVRILAEYAVQSERSPKDAQETARPFAVTQRPSSEPTLTSNRSS